MAQKINEAHEHIAKAEKYLKTSFMKWKPDYDSAASEYSKAAVAFKNAKQLEQAKDAYLQEAEAHSNNRSLFHAAKAFEQAGMMLKDMQRFPEAVEYIEKASVMYVENGTPDTAAMALDRAGKLIEPLDLVKAVHLYQQAAAVFENEERLRQAVELVGKASRLLVRQQKFDEAAVSLQKEKNMYKEIENYPTCFKKTIAQVLVHLHRGDYVAAEKCVRESYSVPGFSGSEDCVALEQLLQGYDERDEEQVSRVCGSPLLKYMDNDYAKLAISLTVPGGGKKKPPAAAGGDPGAVPAEEEEDEYAGGLC
ncbi:N-ethylmaleimide-sensitive factor attachment protein, gamma a [Puntigrus tetrazona]|uniref:N-ethylmaleimide-sensitive factor attachment protein, gamma a n=1 Tax=Puntigrus tetrazona TaxID=1606681 RepID=UPI001C89C570|nr:N-ethylmaleimide-sensitive factor attachment protein, gamma a [Puntigrus tetrazona]